MFTLNLSQTAGLVYKMSTKSVPDVSKSFEKLAVPSEPPKKTLSETDLPGRTRGDGDAPTSRLLLLSNKIKNHSLVAGSLLPGVKLVQYKYESGSLESILNQVTQALNGCQVETIACVLHTKPGSILLCTNGEDKEVRRICSSLV